MTNRLGMNDVPYDASRLNTLTLSSAVASADVDAITALTGDVTATGPGSVAATLATVNANVGTFGSATQVAQVTANAKGLITAISNVTITGASPVGAALTRGSIWRGGATNLAEAYALGAANKVLQSDGTDAIWSNFPLTISGNSTINGSLVGNITGGGTLATGGFTLTVPATGAAALLGIANAFTVANQSITASTATSTLLTLKSSDNSTTKNALEIQNSSGTVNMFVNQAGVTGIGVSAITVTGAVFELLSAAATVGAFRSSFNTASIQLKSEGGSSSTYNPHTTAINSFSGSTFGYTSIRSSDNNNVRPILLNYDSGLVGIGTGITTMPTAALQVDGRGDRIQLQVTGYTTQTATVASISRADTAGTGVRPVLSLDFSGSGADNNGGSIPLLGRTSTTAATAIARLAWSLPTGTHASYKGRVSGYVSDSGGERQWLQVDTDGATSDVLINSLIYGSMYGDDISQLVAVSAASTYYEVGGGLTGGNANGMTFQNSKELLVTVAGKYLVTWSMSLSAGNNDHLEGAVMINSTVAASTENAAHTPGAGDQVPVGGSGILTLAVNDVVKLCVENETDTDDITVSHATLTAVRIGE